ncbi:15655_t:CDS:2, partial [Dentiscutata heterogama]
TQNTSSSQSQPYAIDIQFYDDGTTLIHLVRNTDTEHCFEHILRIRIIHLNGSVTEIDDPDLNLDSVNYCLFYSNFTNKMVNPISIRPLRQQFILVSYLNGSNYWGAVLNWKGEKLSDANGILSELVNFNYAVRITGSADSKVTTFTSLATVDEGYAVLYFKYSDVGGSALMNTFGGLYVSFIGYNTTDTTSFDNPILLFQITSDEMKINTVHCNACFGFCYYCVASISYNNTVYYEEITFCSVKIIYSGLLVNTPTETSMPWNVMSSTPVGGYVFSAVVNATRSIYIYDIDRNTKVNLTYFDTTDIGAYSILKNNITHLFPLRDINGKNTSWSLLAVQLPKTPA